MTGKTLGHYKVLRKLGAGGMGEVYAAEDTKLGREVALKVLPPEMVAFPERRERFEREAKAVAALNHPNIVTVYSVEESEGIHFITMELVRGKTLTDIISKKGLPLARFFEVAIPLVEALSAAHQKGIVHRDIKPDNLMVNEEGRLKILDFGLARLKQEFAGTGVSELPTQSATEEGRILGTVAYMSPEQTEGKSVDHRSDIFSMGIVLYEMATGERPFRGQTTVSVLSAILRDTPASVTEVKPSLPRDLGKIIRRCLAKDPENRYQNAKDIRNDLQELKQDLESGEVLEGAPVAAGRMKWLGPAAVAALALTAAVIGYLLRPGGVAEESGGPPTEGTLTQLTSQAGLEFFPSLSRDGNFFVYAGNATGNWDIYLQRVGGENAMNLTADSAADDTMPAFSPDGRWIAFRSERDGGGIFLMEATGESVRRLTDFGFNPAWSPDGKRIALSTVRVLTSSRSGGDGQLQIVHVDTGQIRAIRVNGDAVQPQWSPHGQRIAFWSISLSGSGTRDIWTVPAEGGEPVAVTRDEHIDWNPVWSPDGKHIYFLSNRRGTMSLWRIAVEEETGNVLGIPELVTTSVAAEICHITLSRDGGRIAYSALVYRSNMQKISFDPDSEAVIGEPAWVTQGSKLATYPDLSPDGKWLAFNYFYGGGQADVAMIRTDGTGTPRQLTNSPQYKNFMPRWSPDGSQMAFYSEKSGSYELWTIKPDGSGLKQLTEAPYDIIHFGWSPDGSQIVYFADGDSSYIFSPGTPWEGQTPSRLPPLSGRGQFLANSWSPDGRWLAGDAPTMAGASSSMVLFHIPSQEYRILPVEGTNPVWLSDNRRLLYVSRGSIHLLDTESGRHHEVLSALPDTVAEFAVSKDDRVIYLERRAYESDIWLLTLNEERN